MVNPAALPGHHGCSEDWKENNRGLQLRYITAALRCGSPRLMHWVASWVELYAILAFGNWFTRYPWRRLINGSRYSPEWLDCLTGLKIIAYCAVDRRRLYYGNRFITTISQGRMALEIAMREYPRLEKLMWERMVRWLTPEHIRDRSPGHLIEVVKWLAKVTMQPKSELIAAVWRIRVAAGLSRYLEVAAGL